MSDTVELAISELIANINKAYENGYRNGREYQRNITPRLAENPISPQAVVGHMPFPGHRTVETIWKQQAAAKRCKRKMEYGFDPESLKAAKG